MIEHVTWEQSIVDVIDSGGAKEYVATMYARAYNSGQSIDWRRVNDAIIARWSKTALREVKKLAWKSIGGRV